MGVQLEKGYTRIANELLEKLAQLITNATWLRILLYTCRITYGWKRKEAESNYGAYATKLRLQKDTIKDVIFDMNKRRIITIFNISAERFVVTINKDWQLWKLD